MLKGFKEFATRGNAADIAVGIIIGAAFGTIVKSLVADVIMPQISLLLGNVGFANLFRMLKEGTAPGPFSALAEAQKAGAVTLNYGLFTKTIICFIIVAYAVFPVIRSINKLTRKEEAPPGEPTTKEYHHCLSTIPIKASRCAFCASELGT